MAEPQPSKLVMRVRSPSPAPGQRPNLFRKGGLRATRGPLYEGLLKNWIYAEVPRPPRRPLALGDMPVTQITEDETEQWHLSCRARKHAVACAKAYRLLSEVMIFADQKRAVARNPVHIKGAGAESAPERDALTADDLVALSDAIEPRYRAMILLATFGALRWSESLGLQRVTSNSIERS